MPMYNLIEYSSNYSKTKGSLWFYSKDEVNNFNASIANDDNFEPWNFWTTVAKTAPNAVNGILKYVAIAVPLKYLSNFWRSLECHWLIVK